MKKLLFVLSIIFIILTFTGASYVLTLGGTANAGYAVIPMVFALICSSGYRPYRDKSNRNNPTKIKQLNKFRTEMGLLVGILIGVANGIGFKSMSVGLITAICYSVLFILIFNKYIKKQK